MVQPLQQPPVSPPRVSSEYPLLSVFGSEVQVQVRVRVDFRFPVHQTLLGDLLCLPLHHLCRE